MIPILISLILLFSSTAYAEKNYKLVFLSKINGPTCRHVEIRDADTDELLQVTTEEELIEEEPETEKTAKEEVKELIFDAGAKTPEEMEDAVKVKNVII